MDIIKGNLIDIAKEGCFDVIAHGCNCFCAQHSGIAFQMVKEFNTDDYRVYKLEDKSLTGDINKLGQIEAGRCSVAYKSKEIDVVNCYTQYLMGTDKRHLDYDALRLCMRKLNHYYKGKKIGLPKIGCGLAGGDWSIVKEIIETELINCKVTVVEF